MNKRVNLPPVYLNETAFNRVIAVSSLLPRNAEIARLVLCKRRVSNAVASELGIDRRCVYDSVGWFWNAALKLGKWRVCRVYYSGDERRPRRHDNHVVVYAKSANNAKKIALLQAGAKPPKFTTRLGFLRWGSNPVWSATKINDNDPLFRTIKTAAEKWKNRSKHLKTGVKRE